MKQTTIDTHLRPYWPVGYVPRKDQKAGDGAVVVVCEEGDYKVIFDPTQREEVKAAEASFNRLKEKGWLAFRIDAKGDKVPGEQIREFDPKAGKILMTPPMRGGR